MVSRQFIAKLTQQHHPVTMEALARASGRDRFAWHRVRQFLRDVEGHDPSLLRVAHLLGIPADEVFESDGKQIRRRACLQAPNDTR